MKRFILALLCVFTISLSASAETWYFKTYKFAFARINSYGTYYWGDWERSNMLITFDLTTDVITVYSQKTQLYKILESGQWEYDSKGGKQISYTMIDQDGDYGVVSLRVEQSGAKQVYIRYPAIAWCYCVKNA